MCSYIHTYIHTYTHTYIQTGYEYTLSTSIACTASRYGSELPGLCRLLISHGHIRQWTKELLDREMMTATPLALLQVCMWMCVPFVYIYMCVCVCIYDSHGHIRQWTKELLDREMMMATPLALM